MSFLLEAHTGGANVPREKKEINYHKQAALARSINRDSGYAQSKPTEKLNIISTQIWDKSHLQSSFVRKIPNRVYVTLCVT